MQFQNVVGLSRFSIKYWGQDTAHYGSTSNDPATCSLEAGERITRVVTYKGKTSYGYSAMLGVQFMTNVKKCPVFGIPSSEANLLSGHQLLVIAGKVHSSIKKLELYFDYGCEKMLYD